MVDKIWYNMEELIGGSEERGINRNILECKARIYLILSCFLPSVLMECKGRCSAFSQEIEKSINRNILECKDRI